LFEAFKGHRGLASFFRLFEEFGERPASDLPFLPSPNNSKNHEPARSALSRDHSKANRLILMENDLAQSQVRSVNRAEPAHYGRRPSNRSRDIAVESIRRHVAEEGNGMIEGRFEP
jgi:hypothetical protein